MYKRQIQFFNEYHAKKSKYISVDQSSCQEYREMVRERIQKNAGLLISKIFCMYLHVMHVILVPFNDVCRVCLDDLGDSPTVI